VRQQLVASRTPPAHLAVLICLTLTGCFAKPSSVVTPLKYRPTSQLNMNTFAGDLPEATVHIAPVVDRRESPQQIGENLENKKPIPVLVGPTQPADFVHDTMATLVGRTGLKVMPAPASADRVLVTELLHFWTRETDTYDAEIRATVAVQDRGGRQLWKGTLNGTAKRFGRSLSQENYQEAFSDAMVELVQGMLNNSGFRAALKR